MDKASLLASAEALTPPSPRAAARLEQVAEQCAEEMTEAMLRLDNLAGVIGEDNQSLMELNHQNHFRYIVSLASLYDPRSFVETVIWVFRTYRAHGFTPAYWEHMLPEATAAVRRHLPEQEAREVLTLYDWLYEHIRDFTRLSDSTLSAHEDATLGAREGVSGISFDSGTRAVDLMDGYLERLLAADRQGAGELILDEVDKGTEVRAIYLSVLHPAMYEVGRLWQEDEIDVAVEHYCTAATQQLMARLFPRALTKRRTGRTVLACCVGSELHELGLRMVSDFFEFEGWDSYYLGARTPRETILEAVHQRRPDLVCLSSAMPFGVPLIRRIITELRETMQDEVPAIMAGGLAFVLNPDLADKVGADGTAANAQETVQRARELGL